MYCEKLYGGAEGGRQGQDDTESLHHLDVGELQNSQGVSKSFALPTFLAATLDTRLAPAFYSQISDLANARLVQL